ncbi:MAG: Nif3-like dinuclear metal center hexameric protein [Candidatus Pacebacteria bacterium]|nr:Nif3-like dinuclear metal center hexameric protein [Candidatus Paceibacterota bacterium]
MKLQKLEQFLKNYWGKDFLTKWQKKDDHGANGLQVGGRENIKKIAFGVSCNADFLHHALHDEVDTCIFHHGLDTRFPQMLMPEYLRKRFKLILENNLNIFGYHGAMDAHPKHGHNTLILKELGVKILGPVMDEWGYYGVLPSPRKLIAIGNQCRRLFDHEVFVEGNPDRKIKRVAVCSGGGIPGREEVVNFVTKKIDLYITGVISESRPHMFSEMGMAYFACGHYATEKIGVLELEKQIKKTFPEIKTVFIDINNPI